MNDCGLTSDFNPVLQGKLFTNNDGEYVFMKQTCISCDTFSVLTLGENASYFSEKNSLIQFENDNRLETATLKNFQFQTNRGVKLGMSVEEFNKKYSEEFFVRKISPDSTLYVLQDMDYFYTAQYLFFRNKLKWIHFGYEYM